MRSIADWLLWASVHQEPVPSQVTADESCAQVTRPGTTPRGTPIGESVDANKEERMQVAEGIERANCRRVICMWSCRDFHFELPGTVQYKSIRTFRNGNGQPRTGRGDAPGAAELCSYSHMKGQLEKRAVARKTVASPRQKGDVIPAPKQPLPAARQRAIRPNAPGPNETS